MKPVFQTKKGYGGDCLAACLSSIFEVSLAEMPDMCPIETYADWSIQPKLRNAWLAARGIGYLELRLSGDHPFVWTKWAIPNTLCLLSVESDLPAPSDVKYGHYVVGRLTETDEEGFEIEVVHDPIGAVKSHYTVEAVGFFIAAQTPPNAVRWEGEG
jgi:hypothetical protein